MPRPTGGHRGPWAYDALIGATAVAEGGTLVTADRRALASYALGADVERVAQIASSRFM